jgi:hypothetical protein
MICTVVAFGGILVIPLNPVNNMILKLAFLGCIGGAWVGFSILTWKRKAVRLVVLILPLLAAMPFLLPGDEIDSGELGQDYVERMSDFEGTRYHWGGESARGIDCSGLPRRALRDALLAYGVRNFNGRAFRCYAEQWWFDASAKALGEGYRGYTTPIGAKGTIKEMDDGCLVPGDLAVTTNGVHILAYAGDGKWIQADPGMGAVVTLDGRTAENGWFSVPVTTHRWRVLSDPSGEE